MGLFGNFFGSGSDQKAKENNVPWISLKSLEQLDEIQASSKTRPQLLFKHSTTCGISSMVLRMFTDSYNLEEGQMDIYFLDLLANRNLSNEISSRFQVMHQSPQLLIIKDEKVVFHTSHGAITEVDLHQFIQ